MNNKFQKKSDNYSSEIMRVILNERSKIVYKKIENDEDFKKTISEKQKLLKDLKYSLSDTQKKIIDDIEDKYFQLEGLFFEITYLQGWTDYKKIIQTL